MNRIILFILFFSLTFGCFGQKSSREIKNVFKEYNIDGALVIYDVNNNRNYTNGHYAIRKDRIPGTSFQLFNALVFYQIGMIKDSSTVMKWDGETNYFNEDEIPVWNRNTTISDAFKNGANWVFKELSEQIEAKIYRKYVRSSSYGKIKSTCRINSEFWNGGIGKVTTSLRKQLSFMEDFNNYTLPFDTLTIDKVKELMMMEQSNGNRLYEKYGLSDATNCFFCSQKDFGWYQGFIETEDNTYYFASIIEKKIKENRSDFFELRKLVVVECMESLFGIKIE